MYRLSEFGWVRVAWAIAAGLLVASCTTSDWQTKNIDHPTTCAPKVYGTDAKGMAASITDHIAVGINSLDQWAPSHGDAACAARRIVDHLGANRLGDLGFDPRRGSLTLNYTEDERNTVINILTGCIDMSRGLLALFDGDQKLDLQAASCITGGISRRGLDRSFAAAYLNGSQPDPFANDNELGVGMLRLMKDCLDPTKDLVPQGSVGSAGDGSDPTTIPS